MVVEVRHRRSGVRVALPRQPVQGVVGGVHEDGALGVGGELGLGEAGDAVHHGGVHKILRGIDLRSNRNAERQHHIVVSERGLAAVGEIDLSGAAHEVVSECRSLVIGVCSGSQQPGVEVVIGGDY